MPSAPPPPTGLNPATFDIGNPLLDESDSHLTATLVTHPQTGAQRLVVTVRTSTATLTVFLDRDKAEMWREIFDAKIAKMTTLTVPGHAPLARPGPFPNGRQL